MPGVQEFGKGSCGLGSKGLNPWDMYQCAPGVHVGLGPPGLGAQDLDSLSWGLST